MCLIQLPLLSVSLLQSYGPLILFLCLFLSCSLHNSLTIHDILIGLGAKSQILSSVAPPQEEKVGYYFQSGACLGASETHVLLSFQFSANGL